MVWTISVICILLAAIVILNSNLGTPRQTQEQFLQSLTDFLEGTLRPIDGQPGGFQIEFFFQGQSFSYEDVPDRGFKEAVRKGYLKTSVHKDFTLYFTEKPRSTTIKTDVLIVSRIPNEPIRPDNRVMLPPSFEGLDVRTNDFKLANRLFSSPKIIDILLGFRSVDSRGYPSMSWKVIDGVMILEFHPAERKVPNYHDLTRRVPVMEDYLEGLSKIVQFFKSL